MKKYIIPIILCIITGFIMANIMFNQYDKTELVSTNIEEKAYFFQVGVFSNFDNMKKETSRYDSYIYVFENDKYYVYVGITKENKDKLKQYFDTLEYDTYIKEININSNFASRLNELDKKLSEAASESIKDVNNEILKTYEEVNNDKN